MTKTYTTGVIEEMRDSIQSILHQWAMPAKSVVSLLNVSENATFIVKPPVDSGCDPIILRVHRPNYHSKQEIESELLWVESLRQQDLVHTAKPLQLKTGGKVASLPNSSEERFVVGFEFLSGSEPSPKSDLRNDFFTLGAITAKLHEHSKNWPIPIGFKRKVWDFDSMLGKTQLWGDFRKAIGLEDEGRKILDETALLLEKQLTAYGKDKSNFSLVHADLRLANLLIDGTQLSVIDFDDCGYSWFMYDFAAAISFIEEDPQIVDLQKSWVDGYRSESFLAKEDEEAIPMFIILRRILLTAWLASHSETETAKELGAEYTAGTIRLSKTYLAQFNTACS